MVFKKVCGLLCLVTTVFPLTLRAGSENATLACDREMRKTFESIQAWRRLHNESYAGRLVDMKTSGLLPNNGAVCPEILRERIGSDPTHTENSSRGPDADPAGTYEYEMSDRVLRSSIDRMYLPAGAPDYTRQ
jgi:hypothetical protein